MKAMGKSTMAMIAMIAMMVMTMMVVDDSIERLLKI